jgi:hypothetical protein
LQILSPKIVEDWLILLVSFELYIRLLLIRTIGVYLIFKIIARLWIFLYTFKYSLSTYIILWVTNLSIEWVSLMITHISSIEITHMVWTIFILILIFLWCYFWATICISRTFHRMRDPEHTLVSNFHDAILFRISSPFACNSLHPW